MPAGRVALVTGGGRGIGARISRRLAQDGFAVAVNYSRSADGAQAVVEEIEALGGRAAAVRGDVGVAAEAVDLVAATAELLGTPTVLVNNAGHAENASACSLGPEAWDRVLGVNLHGAYYCTHAALPGMYAAGWGRVIFLGSPAAGRSVTPTMAAYAAAKAGLVAMTKVLAKEVARRGITANVVVPGFVDTDMTRDAGDEHHAALRAAWPEIPADAVADTVAFLASDQAAYVSGEELGVWLGGPVH